MKLNLPFFGRRARRRDREVEPALEERLSRYGQSLSARPEAKEAGLKRLLAEFERTKRDRPR